MSREAALRQSGHRSAARHIVPGAFAKRGTDEADPTAICHELSERLTAIGNYLETVSRLREIEPASAFAEHAGEILQKALAQVHEGGRTIRRLRRLVPGRDKEDAASASPAQKALTLAYRVRFLNQFARGGAVVRTCQRTITILSARSPERAVEAAKKRFARIERIRDWRIHAQTIELEIITDARRG